jgi:ATP/ADP translocase
MMSRLLLTVCASLLFVVSPAYAYIGPAMGIGTLGAIVAIIGSILFALFAVLWYPLRRMIKRRKARKEVSGAQVAAGRSAADTAAQETAD